MITEGTIRRIVREEIVAALKDIADSARGENRWNYDSVESTALYTLQDHMERAAERVKEEVSD